MLPFTAVTEPGTKVVSSGITSRTIESRAASLPVLLNEIEYSSWSPGTASPPLRSVTVLVTLGNSGTKRSIAVVSTPGYHQSPVVWNLMVELVSPASSTLVVANSSMSTERLLTNSPVPTPPSLIEPLPKFVMGLAASLRLTRPLLVPPPFVSIRTWSPLMLRSPS